MKNLMEREIEASYVRDYELNKIPTYCLVNSHNWGNNGFCRRCGANRDEEMELV
jgi:hypothetical protein